MRNFCLTLYAFLLLASSCNEDAMNKKEIIVKGRVTDNITKIPIAGARVTVLCWYHAGWDKTDYVSIDTIADKDGYFSANFEEGYKVVIAGVAAKYKPNLIETKELNDKNIEMNVVLTKSVDTTDTAYLKISLRNYIVQNSNN